MDQIPSLCETSIWIEMMILGTLCELADLLLSKYSSANRLHMQLRG